MSDLFCPDIPNRPTGAQKIILVAAVLLVDIDGKILLSQRPVGKSMAGLWEFPGGKIEEGETPERALIRELKEELNINTTQACFAPFTFASHTYEDFHLLMPCFLCRKWDGFVTGAEGQKVTWVKPEDLKNYPMPPADKPLLAMIRDFI